MSDGGFLIVGGDSTVGTALFEALERRGHHVYATTRRTETVGGRRVFLDYEDEGPAEVPDGVRYAYIVAAATGYGRCEQDPAAYRINVDHAPHTAAVLLERGVSVTFVSTNSVFGGERPWPAEEDPHAPGIAYARQKSEAERVLRVAARKLGAEERLNIVRLTKILDRETPPLPAWLSAWAQGQPVEPFADLIFAPMSPRFVGDALTTLGEKRIPGDLHLSGAENVSYVDVARSLAERLEVDPNLIAPTTASEKGVEIAFKPRYSGLGMRRTTRLAGIEPQALSEVVDYLTASVTA